MEDWIENLEKQLNSKQTEVESKILGENPKLKAAVEKCNNEIGGMKMNYDEHKNSRTALHKVQLKIQIDEKDAKEKKLFYDEIKKRMFDVKKEQLAELEENQKEKYKEVFDFENHKREVQEIERQQLKDRTTTPIPKEADKLREAKDKAAKHFKRVTPNESQDHYDYEIEHNGRLWHYEKRGTGESFYTKNGEGEKIAIVKRRDELKGFDYPGNASVEYKDAKSGEIVKSDKLPLDIEPALEIGKREADKHSASLDRNNLDDGKSFSNEFDAISNPDRSPEAENNIILPGEEEINNNPIIEVPEYHDPEIVEQETRFPGYEEVPLPNNDLEIEEEFPIEAPGIDSQDEISLSNQFPGQDYVEAEIGENEPTTEIAEKTEKAEISEGFPGEDYYSGEDSGYTVDVRRDFSTKAKIDTPTGPDVSVGEMD